MEKFEINLESLQASGQAVPLKAGDKVYFEQQPDGSIVCHTRSGNHIGTAPVSAVDKLAAQTHHGEVRTLRKSPDSEYYTLVTIRCQPGELQLKLDLANALQDNEAEQDEEIRHLTRDQLESLGHDEKVQWYLRDEKLQKVLQQIDSAANREKALIDALKSPNFKEFSDYILQHTVAVDEQKR